MSDYDEEEEFVDLSDLQTDLAGGLFKPVASSKPTRYEEEMIKPQMEESEDDDLPELVKDYDFVIEAESA